jgi:hypothetical protein
VKRAMVLGVASLFLAIPITFTSSPAMSAQRPTLTLSVPNDQVNAGQSYQVAYSTARLPSSARLFLQRQFGTAHVWKSVLSLTARSGVANAPALPMGETGVRLYADVDGVRTTSKVDTVYAYGPVSIDAICASPGTQSDTDSGCSGGNEQIGSNIFVYNVMLESNDDQYPNFNDAITSSKTTCRSGTLQFAEQSSFGSYQTWVEIVQSASDPQVSTTPPDSIGTFTFSLDGGPWYLETSGNNTSFGTAVAATGTFQCYTPSGT